MTETIELHVLGAPPPDDSTVPERRPERRVAPDREGCGESRRSRRR
jgi:hypothetical protein